MKNFLGSVSVKFCQEESNSIKGYYERDQSFFNYTSQKIREELENISNAIYHLDPIPEGFVYVQFPNQSTLQDLGMGPNWVDITKEYAGLFSRAEGNGSEPFGEIQQANQSIINQISAWGVYYDSWDKSSSTSAKTTKTFKRNGWTPLHILKKPRSNRVINHLSFRTTEGEVRPTNTAIRVWKKVSNVKP